jgi:hypothetical protein
MLIGSLMLSCCGTNEAVLKRCGNYDSVPLGQECEMWDMWQIDSGWYPQKICINLNGSDESLLDQLIANNMIKRSKSYRLEKDVMNIWVFENDEPKIILEKIGE